MSALQEEVDEKARASATRAATRPASVEQRRPDGSVDRLRRFLSQKSTLGKARESRRATLTSARFSISHLLRIFMANTLSVFRTFTTATCKRGEKSAAR